MAEAAVARDPAVHLLTIMEDTPLARRAYRVLVAENSHYMDEAEPCLGGEYDTCQAAIRECQRIVDTFLAASYRPTMTAGELMELYTTFGGDPFITSSDPGCVFSAWTYARRRSAEICSQEKGV